MGTLSKSLTENLANKLSTWTFTASCNDVSVTGDTFPVPLPTVTAKYVYSGKNVAYVTEFRIYPVVGSSSYSSNWSNFTYGGGSLASNPWASNASKTLSRTGGGTILSDRTTSTFFKASNKTTRTITLTYKCYLVSAESAIKSSDGYIYESNLGQLRLYSNDTGMPFDIATANITLNVPPTLTVGTPTYTTPYAGVGSYSVPITSAEAYYGGDISKVTLTVGQDSTVQTYSAASISNKTISVTPTVAGTYTPVLTVEDSRGQITTETLTDIVVNPYLSPSLDFDVFRSNSSGVKDDEGAYGLITANVSFTDAIADLTQPTVQINGTTTSSVTWYSVYNGSTGVSSAISDWSTVSSGDTIYGLINGSFAQTDSYLITVTIEDSLGGPSSAITQTLSTAFYTIDFQAGGKEIAFGAPANDDITDYPEGLFKCAMSFVNVNMVGEIKAYAGVTVPNGWLECDGSEVLKADYPILYGAIADSWGVASDADHFVLPNMKGRVPVGYDSSDTDFDSVGESGGAKSVTLGTDEIPAHTHGNKSLTGVFRPQFYSGQSASGIASMSSANYNLKNPGSGSVMGAANVTINASHEHTSVGGGDAHNNLQPYAVVKYIICAI